MKKNYKILLFEIFHFYYCFLSF